MTVLFSGRLCHFSGNCFCMDHTSTLLVTFKVEVFLSVETYATYYRRKVEVFPFVETYATSYRRKWKCSLK